MISCGARELTSRLPRLTNVLSRLVIAMLKVPLPVIRDVTSIVTQVPRANLPLEPPGVPKGGALLKVMLFSPQEVFETPYTLIPTPDLLFA